MPILAAGDVAAQHAKPAAIHVFADLQHTGKLSGPLAASPTAANEFGIAVPLPASCADRDALPARVAGGEDIAQRLGRLRVQANKGAGGLLISISSDNGRCLRLFHKVDGIWRRAAPKVGESWTTGFKVLLPSPEAARKMLDALLREGLGEVVVFAETDEEMTAGELRETIAVSDENLVIDDTIARIRERLKTEMNLENADFVMVPALFQWGRAVIPNAVNSVVVNRHVLVPEPHGPRHNGKDCFEEAIRGALAACDVRVVFIDTWNAYHSAGGEIHCGTNTFRRLRDPAWWTHVVKSGDQVKAVISVSPFFSVALHWASVASKRAFSRSCS
ncbi:MAG: protein-arginine deiminase family protein [Isosphaerales bacterium]